MQKMLEHHNLLGFLTFIEEMAPFSSSAEKKIKLSNVPMSSMAWSKCKGKRADNYILLLINITESAVNAYFVPTSN